MNLLSLVSIIGFVQLCSSASVHIEDMDAGYSHGFSKKLGEISEKVKKIHGVNLQWIDEFINVSKKNNYDDLLHVKIENDARLMSLAFGVDFATVNHTYYEIFRDIFDLGVDIPIENRTVTEYFREYGQRLAMIHVYGGDVISVEEGEQKVNATLTRSLGATKARKIFEFDKAFSDFDENVMMGRKTTVNTNLIDILVSIFRDGAGAPKRPVCGIITQVFRWRFDCSVYANEINVGEDENDVTHSGNEILKETNLRN